MGVDIGMDTGVGMDVGVNIGMRIKKLLRGIRTWLVDSPVYAVWKRIKGMSAVWWYGHPSRGMIVIGVT